MYIDQFPTHARVDIIFLISFVNVCSAQMRAVPATPSSVHGQGMATKRTICFRKRCQVCSRTGFSSLPNELKAMIGEHMDMHALASMARVDKQSHEVFGQVLWQRHPGQALVWHCYNCDVKAVRKALKNGADVEFSYIVSGCHMLSTGLRMIRDGSETPLYRAALSGDIDVVKLLLHRGAKVSNPACSAADILRRTMCEVGYFPGLPNLLARYGADLNEKDHSGRSPLHVAAKDNYSRTIQELIESGADISSKNCSNKTPLMLAAGNGNVEGAKVILNALKRNGILAEKIEEMDSSGYTALHLAECSGCADTIAALLDFEADPTPRQDLLEWC